MSVWLVLIHRSSCFILSTKAGPSPTTKHHLDIAAGNKTPPLPKPFLIALVLGSPSLPSTVALTFPLVGTVSTPSPADGSHHVLSQAHRPCG